MVKLLYKPLGLGSASLVGCLLVCCSSRSGSCWLGRRTPQGDRGGPQLAGSAGGSGGPGCDLWSGEGRGGPGRRQGRPQADRDLARRVGCRRRRDRRTGGRCDSSAGQAKQRAWSAASRSPSSRPTAPPKRPGPGRQHPAERPRGRWPARRRTVADDRYLLRFGRTHGGQSGEDTRPNPSEASRTQGGSHGRYRHRPRLEGPHHGGP
jgi:hypothetical protein